MIQKLPLYFLLLFLLSCQQAEKKAPVTDIDVATAFIRNVLDNDFKGAEQFLLKDDTNQRLFVRFQKQYQEKDKTELNKYKVADIIINGYENLNDTLTIVNYSNSYKADNKTKIKVVRTLGKWQVDFKYTYIENMQP